MLGYKHEGVSNHSWSLEKDKKKYWDFVNKNGLLRIIKK